MKIDPVQECNVQFSKLPEQVQSDSKIPVADGTTKKAVAVQGPQTANQPQTIRLGILSALPFNLHDDLAMTEADLLDM
ncbi:MAG: hypothetical protein KDE31_23030 [Caldilineaceae bacterium]|nr:hypothetical protein [Caldilineaceae bacterium]